MSPPRPESLLRWLRWRLIDTYFPLPGRLPQLFVLNVFMRSPGGHGWSSLRADSPEPSYPNSVQERLTYWTSMLTRRAVCLRRYHSVVVSDKQLQSLARSSHKKKKRSALALWLVHSLFIQEACSVVVRLLISAERLCYSTGLDSEIRSLSLKPSERFSTRANPAVRANTVNAWLLKTQRSSNEFLSPELSLKLRPSYVEQLWSCSHFILIFF